MIFRTNKYGNAYPIKPKEIKLKSNEYAHVCSEIETHGTKKQKIEGQYNHKNIGLYNYIYIYNKDTNIKFYDKIRIAGNESKIEKMDKILKEINKNVYK